MFRKGPRSDNVSPATFMYIIGDTHNSDDGRHEEKPVSLAESSQTLGERSEERPDFEDNLEQENAHTNRRDQDAEDQENGHESVCIGDHQSFDLGLNTVCVLHNLSFGTSLGLASVEVGSVD
jgi:hypothetical protein